MHPVRACVRPSVRDSVIPFVTFYKNLYFSASIKGIFTNFAHNVYIQENTPSTNFGLILKKKMAAIAISLLKNVFFHTALPGAIFKLGFSNLQGIFTVGRPSENNFGLILKNKMAATAISLLKNVFFSHSSTRCNFQVRLFKFAGYFYCWKTLPENN